MNPAISQEKLTGSMSLKGGETLSGQFNQNRYLAGFKAPLKTSGDFYLVPELGLAWIVKKPFTTRLLMTSSSVTQITHGEVMQVGNAGFAEIFAKMMHPVLSHDWEQLKQSFDVQLRNLTDTGSRWKVTLTPLDSRMLSFVTTIVIEGAEQTELLIIKKASGDRDEIAFMNQLLWEKPSQAAVAAFDAMQDK